MLPPGSWVKGTWEFCNSSFPACKSEIIPPYSWFLKRSAQTVKAASSHNLLFLVTSAPTEHVLRWYAKLRRCRSFTCFFFFFFFKPTGEIDGFSVIQGWLEKLWDTPEISPKGWRGNELQRTNLKRHWREKKLMYFLLVSYLTWIVQRNSYGLLHYDNRRWPVLFLYLPVGVSCQLDISWSDWESLNWRFACGHVYGDIFWIVNWCWRAQTTMGDTTSGQAVLG